MRHAHTHTSVLGDSVHMHASRICTEFFCTWGVLACCFLGWLDLRDVPRAKRRFEKVLVAVVHGGGD